MGRAAGALDLAMGEALEERPGLSAIACLDAQLGALLGAAVRSDSFKERLDVVANAAAHFCTAPNVSNPFEETTGTDEALVVFGDFMVGCARVRDKRDLFVVGLAETRANVALFLLWIEQVAAHVAGLGR